MGWNSHYDWKTKKDIVSAIIAPFTNALSYKLLKKTVKGNYLWLLVEHLSGELKGDVYITSFLLDHSDGEWSWKEVGETGDLSCPQAFINMIVKNKKPLSERTLVWHEKIKVHNAKSKITLVKGSTFKLYGKIYEFIEKVGPRSGWNANLKDDTEAFYVSPKQIKNDVVFL